MSNKRAMDTIEEVAAAASEGLEAGNFISIGTAADRSRLVLTTVIRGKSLAWITYDKQQLAELIRLLQMHGADLK